LKKRFEGQVGESQTAPLSMSSGPTAKDVPSIPIIAATKIPHANAF